MVMVDLRELRERANRTSVVKMFFSLISTSYFLFLSSIYFLLPAHDFWRCVAVSIPNSEKGAAPCFETARERIAGACNIYRLYPFCCLLRPSCMQFADGKKAR